MRKKLSIILLSAISAFSLGAVITGSLSWFVTSSNFKNVDIDGVSDAAYFASGTGVSGDPYIIKTRRHLYNLAWLQDMGRFNAFDENDVIKQQYYFKIDASLLANGLDMGGMVLPPIGTEQYPFLGSFDGSGVTIKNLATSNLFSDYEDDHPLVINSFGTQDGDVNQPNIVGFFGVVGKISGNYNYSSSINEIKDFTLSDYTAKTDVSPTLIGIVGGYVNGKMSGIKIGTNTSLDLGKTAKSAIGAELKNVSDHTLVGYTTATGSTGTYSQDLSSYYHIGGKGHSTTEGGTFSSRDYMEWMYNTRSNYTQSAPSGIGNNYLRERSVSGTGGYAINYTTVKDTANNNPVTSNNKGIIYRLRDNSYVPLLFEPDDFKSTTTPLASNANTGYLVGSNIGSQANASPKIGAYNIRNLVNSLYDTNDTYNNYKTAYDANLNLTYDNEKVEILTYSMESIGNKTEKHWVRIKDDYNSGHNKSSKVMGNYYKGNETTPSSLGFQKYNDARAQLSELFSGSNYVHGIHFDTNVISYSNLTNISANVAKADGKTVTTTYPVPKGSINFKLSQTGYINFFAGTYNSSDNNTTDFFSLYHIKRGNNYSISSNSIKKIVAVYENKQYNADPQTSKTKYIYQYEGNTATYSSIMVKNQNGEYVETAVNKNSDLGTKVFDLSSALMTVCKVKNALYYFEIPVNDDEFAMGASNTGSGGGAYLIYLDLQTNGLTPDSDEISAYSVTTYNATIKHPYGVDFGISTLNSAEGGKTLGLIISSSSNNQQDNNSITFTINGTSVYYTTNLTNLRYSYKTIGLTTTVGQTPPDDPPTVSTNGTRDIYIKVKTLTTPAHLWEIVITGELNAQGAVPSYTYSLIKYDGTPKQESDLSELTSLTAQILAAIKTSVTDKIITLTRRPNSGTNAFNAVPTYTNTPPATTGYKTVDIALDATGIIIDITNKSADYTITINGTPVSNDQSENYYPRAAS